MKKFIPTVIIIFTVNFFQDCKTSELENSANEFMEMILIPIADMEEGPVTLFEKACANCHGPQGAVYGDTFTQLQGDALHDEVKEMMLGPGQLNPTEAQINAMSGYHDALREKDPFITINNAESYLNGTSATLWGDVLPETDIEIQKGKQIFKPEIEGFTWKLTEAPNAPFNIRIKNNIATVTYTLANQN